MSEEQNATIIKLSQANRMLAEAETFEDIKKVHDIATVAVAYAKAAKLGLEAQNTAARIKVEAEVKAGEIFRQLERGAGGDRRSGGFQNFNVKNLKSEYAAAVEEAKISQSKAAMWQIEAELPKEEREELYENATKAGREITSHLVYKEAKNRKRKHEAPDEAVPSKPHVAHNSGNNEWYTPEEFIKAAKRTMGGIDLDPASNEIANQVVGAEEIWTVDDDGLSHDWWGRVWMNPPYSSNLVKRFVWKLLDEVEVGNVSEAIVLVNNATETNWFGDLVSISSAVCFPYGRIRFWSPNGEIGAPLQGQAIVYIGKRIERFVSEFRDLGWLADVRK